MPDPIALPGPASAPVPGSVARSSSSVRGGGEGKAETSFGALVSQLAHEERRPETSSRPAHARGKAESQPGDKHRTKDAMAAESSAAVSESRGDGPRPRSERAGAAKDTAAPDAGRDPAALTDVGEGSAGLVTGIDATAAGGFLERQVAGRVSSRQEKAAEGESDTQSLPDLASANIQSGSIATSGMQAAPVAALAPDQAAATQAEEVSRTAPAPASVSAAPAPAPPNSIESANGASAANTLVFGNAWPSAAAASMSAAATTAPEGAEGPTTQSAGVTPALVDSGIAAAAGDVDGEVEDDSRVVRQRQGRAAQGLVELKLANGGPAGAGTEAGPAGPRDAPVEQTAATVGTAPHDSASFAAAQARRPRNETARAFAHAETADGFARAPLAEGNAAQGAEDSVSFPNVSRISHAGQESSGSAGTGAESRGVAIDIAPGALLAAMGLHVRGDAAVGTYAPRVPDENASARPVDYGPFAGDEPHQQIVKSIRLQWSQGVGEARLHLHPEHLGDVTIKLRVEQGGVTASLRTDNAAAADWIRVNRSELEASLGAQGLSLDTLDVVIDPDDRRRDQPSREPADEAPRQKRARADQPRFEILV